MSCGLYQQPFEIPPQNNGGGGGETNTASNVGGGVELFKMKDGVDLQLRTLISDTPQVDIQQLTNNVKINVSGLIANGSEEGNTLRWDGSNWVENDGLKSYSGSVGIRTEPFTSSTFSVLDPASGTGVFAVNVQSHNFCGIQLEMFKEIGSDTAIGLVIKTETALYEGKFLELIPNGGTNRFSVNYQGKLTVEDLKSTTAHPGSYHALFVDDTTGLVYSQAVTSGGETNTGSNLGAGAQVFKQKDDVDFEYRTLVAGSDISITENANDIVIAFTGSTGGLSYWTESEYTFTGLTGTKFIPSSANTNQSIVLQPKGTGAVIVQQPDGTIAGGQNRGNYAVDLQLVRTASTQVASGESSVIGGGRYNTATATTTTVAGGQQNTASGTASFIGGGRINTAGGLRAVIVGGDTNTNVGISSFLGAGYSNEVNANYSVLCGGQNNEAAGGYDAVISGQNNTNYASFSVLGGGLNNSIDAGAYNFLGGGNENTLDGTNTFTYAVLVGGYTNEVHADYSAMVGGRNGYISYGNLYGFIGAGENLTLNSTSGWSAIVGGKDNVINASGHYNFIGGGLSTQIQGTSGYSVNVGGQSNIISDSNHSSILGGYQNHITSGRHNSAIIGTNCVIEGEGQYSIALGFHARSRRYGELKWNIGNFSVTGDNGSSWLQLKGTTTTNSPVELFLGGSSLKRLEIPANTTCKVAYHWIRRRLSDNSVTSSGLQFALVNKGATDASTTLITTFGDTTRYGNDAGFSAGIDDLTVTADTTNGSLKFEATGQPLEEIRWFVFAQLIEITEL